MARKTSSNSKSSWSELEGLRKRVGQSVAVFCRCLVQMANDGKLIRQVHEQDREGI